MTSFKHNTALKDTIIETYGTPCAVVDLDIVEQNIQRVQRLCDNADLANRPHIKTHKSSKLAHMQLNAGAQGITCQKLGEAKIMADAGIKDIIIATNLLGAARSGQLAAVHQHTSLKVCADNTVALNAYAKAAQDANKPIQVLIECDTGQHRAGVETPEEALKLAATIKDDPMLQFEGWLFYPPLDGWPASQVFLDKVSAGLSELNLQANIISTGGTPNLVNLGKLQGATEHRAGTCIFNDRMMINANVATLEDCALQIYTSVVSRAGKDRGILDAGSKTFTTDTGGLNGFGYIIEYPDAHIHKFAEEHGFLDLSICTNKPEIGDIVRVIPNHACVCVNMFDQLIAIRGNQIVDVLPVEARGKLV